MVCDCLSASPGVLGQPSLSIPLTSKHRTGDIFLGRKAEDGEWSWSFVRRKETLLRHSSGRSSSARALERAARAVLRDSAAGLCAVGNGRAVRRIASLHVALQLLRLTQSVTATVSHRPL